MTRHIALLVGLLAPTDAAAGPWAPVEVCLPVRALSAGVDPLGSSSMFIDSDGRLCHNVAVTHTRLNVEDDGAAVSPSRAFASSALLPGMGQRYLGQGRWIAYLGIEAWAWIQFFDERSEGSALQTDYRDLAWSVARRVSSGPRVDGDFEYYEAMTKFAESGAFDAEPQRPGLQPETDVETFNGSLWQLAREIYFAPDDGEPVSEGSPAYQNALQYYRERSITPGFTWSWRENELQQSVYGSLIEQSDENLRNSTTMAGVIILNHVVSAVDALISARLRLQDPDALSLSVVPLLDRRQDWAFVVRVSP
jgi:hypothetical protein